MTTSSGGSRVEGTRERILAILRRRDGVGINELADEIGLAGATVRRHLDVLLRDGHVAVQQVRGRTGRPRYVFTLTEAGVDLFPHHYVRLTHRLLDEIVSLQAGETEGRDGEALAHLVFDRMADRLAREYAPRVRSGGLEERARHATQLLAEEGLDFEVVTQSEQLQLLGRGCPCVRLGRAAAISSAAPEPDPAPPRAAGASTGCSHDRRLFERLLGARVLPLDEREIPHDFLCGYSLEEGPAVASGLLA